MPNPPAHPCPGTPASRLSALALAVVLLLAALVVAAPAQAGGRSRGSAHVALSHAAAYRRCRGHHSRRYCLRHVRRARTHRIRAATADPSVRIGAAANTIRYGPAMDRAQSEIHGYGAGWLRENFNRNDIETRPGVYDFSDTDRVVEEAAKHSMTILPLLIGTPRWEAGQVMEIPQSPAGFAAFTAKVTARYAPGGTFWAEHPELSPRPATHFEIWNEPYYEVFNNGHPDAMRYGRLVAAAASAGKRANPRAKFLAAADYYGVEPRRHWVDNMYKAVPNLNSLIDGVAVHPYTGGGEGPDAQGDEPFSRIKDIRAQFASHGGGRKPLWITEIGWSTCPELASCVTERQQASYLSKVVRLARGHYRGMIGGVFFYGWKDDGNGDGTDKEQWFGMLDRRGAPKPALAALRSTVLG